ncbi:aminotransferase class IV [Microbacterium sp. G2-8]|uniref:aminotransferase class IV n=1 Tax=Microbacterium sp. G2-8 TaxID=2842454 RepID=UPI001C89E68B|nr:aminotransferase class IV [Microbacterium sp. G2-8]
MTAVAYRFPLPVAGDEAPLPELAPVAVDDPAISVMDAAAERGDGVFETFGVVDGAVQATRDHLDRLATSMRILDLPDPDLAALADICRQVARTAEPGVESWLKLVVTRGGMDRRTPSAWIVLSPAGDFDEVRTVGRAVITADRGFPSDYAAREPWALIGAKTLSYAQNMAALREAARRGADDMLWVTSDGFLLEAPQSTLVFRRGSTLHTPDPSLGTLHGTAQRAVFRWAAQRGLDTQYGRYGVDDLRDADAAWLTSSVRLATPIRSVDGDALPVDRTATDDMNAFLLARRE